MAPTQPFKARAKKPTSGQAKTPTDLDRRQSYSSTQQRAGTSRSPERDRGHHATERSKKRRRHHVERKLRVGDNNNEEISSSDDSGDSDLDLSKPLDAIGDHLDDRRTLVGEMFKSLKNGTLMRMIPPVLRELSQKELESKCVFELDGLSRKRIRGILAGQDVVSSSGTDDSDDEKDAGKSAATVAFQQASTAVKGLSTVSAPPADRQPTSRIGSSNSRGQNRSLSPVNPSVYSGSRTSVDSLCMNEVEPMELELVELELRAQAIRAMMKQLEDDDGQPRHLAGSSSRSRSKSTSSPSLSISAALAVGDLVKKTEKDLFEIHVDEDELAEFL